MEVCVKIKPIESLSPALCGKTTSAWVWSTGEDFTNILKLYSDEGLREGRDPSTELCPNCKSIMEGTNAKEQEVSPTL